MYLPAPRRNDPVERGQSGCTSDRTTYVGHYFFESFFSQFQLLCCNPICYLRRLIRVHENKHPFTPLPPGQLYVFVDQYRAQDDGGGQRFESLVQYLDRNCISFHRIEIAFFHILRRSNHFSTAAHVTQNIVTFVAPH